MTNQHIDEGLSLKDVILKGQEYFKYLLRNWKWILIPVVIFVGVKIYQAYSTPPRFKAYLTFILNDNKGGAAANISSLLGSFGFGGGGNASFNASTLVEMSMSLKMIQQVLLTKTKIDEQEDFLANHIIREYKMHEIWEKEDAEFLKGFLFTHDTVSSFSNVELAVIKMLHGKVLGASGDDRSLIMFSKNEETGIITLSTETTSQELSIKLSDILYTKLKDFYITKTTQQQIQTFKLISEKTDSLFEVLRQKEYNLAKFKDSNRNLWTLKDQVDQQRLEREVSIVTLMYGESVKNREYADFALKNSLPSIEAIDKPFPPIYGSKPSMLMNIIMGVLLGGLIGTAILIVRKLYHDIMNSE